MQSFIYGDSLRDYCVSFSVIDPEKAKKYAKEHGVTPESLVKS